MKLSWGYQAPIYVILGGVIGGICGPIALFRVMGITGESSWVAQGFGTLAGMLTGVVGGTVLSLSFVIWRAVARGKAEARFEQERSQEVKLRNMCYHELPGSLASGVEEVLKLSWKLRDFVTPPDTVTGDWIDPGFRDECLAVTEGAISSVGGLAKQWIAWREKEIPEEKTRARLEEDCERLREFSEHLAEVLSDAQDVVVSRSKDWSGSLAAVKNCRKYAEIWKKSPIV